VDGDWLSTIALKYLGSAKRYTEIYDANQSVIEAAAREHPGPPVFGNSDHGHWIFPGTVLSIPGAGCPSTAQPAGPATLEGQTCKRGLIGDLFNTPCPAVERKSQGLVTDPVWRERIAECVASQVGGRLLGATLRFARLASNTAQEELEKAGYRLFVAEVEQDTVNGKIKVQTIVKVFVPRVGGCVYWLVPENLTIG
jgi:hypothetical protein